MKPILTPEQQAQVTELEARKEVLLVELAHINQQLYVLNYNPDSPEERLKHIQWEREIKLILEEAGKPLSRAHIYELLSLHLSFHKSRVRTLASFYLIDNSKWAYGRVKIDGKIFFTLK